MSDLHHYGLVRFSKKTGTIDTTMTGLGKGLIQLWTLQNTTKAKACVIIDIRKRLVIFEYIGTADGFPEIHQNQEDFTFDFPDELFSIFEEEVAKQSTTA